MKQAVVEFLMLVNHFIDAEPFPNSFAPSPTELESQLPVAEKLGNGIRKSAYIIRSNEKTRNAVNDHFWNPFDREGDNRLPGAHRFEIHKAERFPPGRKRQQV